MNTTITRRNNTDNTCNKTLSDSAALKKCNETGIINMSQMIEDCNNDYQVKIC